MSKVKGKNTQLELLIFDSLLERSIKFEKHYDIYGKPDIVFPDKKIAIFIDGDFWHGWKFRTYKEKLNEYWYQKISQNIKRDRKNRMKLKNDGWMVIRFWEHKIKKNLESCINQILKELEK